MNANLVLDLKRNYNSMPANHFADKYGKSIASIYILCSKLKLTCKYQLIDNEEDIIDEYNCGLSLKNLSKKYGNSRKTLINLLKESGCNLRDRSVSHRRFSVDEWIFQNIDSHEKAYLLGFIYSDGNVYKNKLQIAIHKNDIEILRNFKKIMKSNHKLYNDKTIKRFIIRSEKIVNDLFKLGVNPRKSLVLKFPTTKQVGLKYINSFILGFFDGDGHISMCDEKNGAQFGLTSTFEFLESVRNILKNELNVNSSLYKEKRSLNNTWYLRIWLPYKSEKTNKIYSYLYKNISFSLKRKKNKFIKSI